MFGPERLIAFFRQWPAPRRYRVAFSGGLDSTVLLHSMALLRDRLSVPVDAVHINHGLHPSSGEWSAQCMAACDALGIPCRTLRVDARPRRGEGPEAAAREARYRALADTLEADTWLLTAHHRDDQAETALLQLLRGAGPHGLAGMPVRRRLGRGWLVRPLLAVPRRELQAWAEEHGLHWIEDPSNFDVTLDRNRLRREILPVLTRWRPGVPAAMARSASHCAEAAALLDELADADLAAIADGEERLDIGGLNRISPARSRNVLRRWIQRAGLPVPDTANLNRILSEAATAAEDAQPCVSWRGAEVRRYRQRLYALAPLPPPPCDWSRQWRSREALQLPAGLGVLEARPVEGRGIRAALFDSGAVTVQFRRGGERCRPVGRGHSHPLKKLFQEAGVPPWERNRMPVILVNGEVAAVAGFCVDEAFAAGGEEPGIEPVWHRSRH